MVVIIALKLCRKIDKGKKNTKKKLRSYKGNKLKRMRNREIEFSRLQYNEN